MEIDKVLFENLRTLGITSSFEELDVDGDGKINDNDLKKTSDTKLYSQISMLLDAADDEAELMQITKAGVTKNEKSGLYELSAGDFENSVYNSTGTTYVVLRTEGCQGCINLAKKINENSGEFAGKANIYEFYGRSSNKEDNKLFWELVEQAGLVRTEKDGSRHTGVPIVLKFVDGKFKEAITGDGKIDAMLKKIEGTISDNNSIDVNNNTDNTNTVDNTNTTNSTNDSNSTVSPAGAATGTYAELQAQLTKLNEEITALNEEIEALEAQNVTLKAEKEELEEQQKAKQAELEQANAELEKAEDDLNVYIVEYGDIQQDMDDLNRQILREQNREQEEYDNDVRKFTNQAIDAYNPENDGDDFNAYFARKMDSFGFPAFTKLASLNDDAATLSNRAEATLQNITSKSAVVYQARVKANRISSELASINTALQSKTDSINANNTKIASLQTDVNTKNAQKAEINKEIQKLIPGGGLTAAEVLAQISECEKNCAKELGWKLEDCYVAQGADGKFHIYPKSGGAGAVRQYYGNKGDMYGTDSLNYVPMGSGFISCVTDVTESGGGRAVYQFSCVNDDWTDGEACCFAGCYQTCSPLSFDIDGDGVNTSTQTISYDIDGDGVKDTINNSAEWVLAFDKDGNGIAGENGSELFGDNTDLDGDGLKDGYADGFEALRALAVKEGLISATDNMLDENDIKKLQEKYGLVMTNGYGGEAKNLTDLGITQINLGAEDKGKTMEYNFDGMNNNIMRQEGATFVVNGQTREYADIWNAKKEAYDDTSKIEARLNPEMEKFTEASVRVTQSKVLALNKDGVVALKGNVDFKAIKDSAENKAEAPKVDILDDVVELKEDEEII